MCNVFHFSFYLKIWELRKVIKKLWKCTWQNAVRNFFLWSMWFDRNLREAHPQGSWCLIHCRFSMIKALGCSFRCLDHRILTHQNKAVVCCREQVAFSSIDFALLIKENCCNHCLVKLLSLFYNVWMEAGPSQLHKQGVGCSSCTDARQRVFWSHKLAQLPHRALKWGTVNPLKFPVILPEACSLHIWPSPLCIGRAHVYVLGQNSVKGTDLACSGEQPDNLMAV